MSNIQSNVTPEQVRETILTVYNFYKDNKIKLKGNYNEADKTKFTFEMFLFALATSEHKKYYEPKGLIEEHKIFDECCCHIYNYLKKNTDEIKRCRPKGKNITEHTIGYLYHSLNQYINE